MSLKRVITVLEIELHSYCNFIYVIAVTRKKDLQESQAHDYHDIHWEVERLSEEQLSFAKPRHCTLHKTRVLPSAPCPDMASERQSLAARNTNSRSTSHYLPTAKEVL